MLFRSPVSPTSEDVSAVIDRVLPRSYARPYLYNSLVELAQELHEEASNSHPNGLKLSRQPDTSKWSVEGRIRDAELLGELIVENKTFLGVTVRRRLTSLKSLLLQESKQMHQALTASSTLVASAMEKRRQALALTELLPYMTRHSFVYHSVFVTATQLDSEAKLLEQITSRTNTNTKAVVPMTPPKDNHSHRHYVTNPTASLEERKNDIAFLEDLLFMLTCHEEDQDASVHTHLLLCLRACHRDVKALEKHMAVLKDVHQLEQRATSLVSL